MDTTRAIIFTTKQSICHFSPTALRGFTRGGRITIVRKYGFAPANAGVFHAPQPATRHQASCRSLIRRPRQPAAATLLRDDRWIASGHYVQARASSLARNSCSPRLAIPSAVRRRLSRARRLRHHAGARATSGPRPPWRGAPPADSLWPAPAQRGGAPPPRLSRSRPASAATALLDRVQQVVRHAGARLGPISPHRASDPARVRPCAPLTLLLLASPPQRPHDSAGIVSVGMPCEKWAKDDGCIYKSSPMVCRDNCAPPPARPLAPARLRSHDRMPRRRPQTLRRSPKSPLRTPGTCACCRTGGNWCWLLVARRTAGWPSRASVFNITPSALRRVPSSTHNPFIVSIPACKKSRAKGECRGVCRLCSVISLHF